MTTYATGNPLGSKDPRDLYDNAENFDAAMNDRTNVAWRDRFGVSRKTWFGIEDQVNTFLARSGFELPPLQYVDGSPLTVDRSTQTIERGGNLYSVKLPSSFPVVLSGNWSEDEGHLLFEVISLFVKKLLARLPAKDLRSLVTQLYLYLQLRT